MKKFLYTIFIVLVIISFAGCGSPASNETANQGNTDNEGVQTMKITILDTTFSADLENNRTVEEFIKLLPMTINMSELNGNEKYYYLDVELPTHTQRVGQINAGDIMLWGNDCIVIFYESFTTSYQYTKIGHINNADNLANLMGSGSVQVQWEA